MLEVQINALGSRLNTALAQLAAEERARAQLEAADLMVRKATAMFDAEKPCGAEANTGKMLASEADCADHLLLNTQNKYYFRMRKEDVLSNHINLVYS